MSNTPTVRVPPVAPGTTGDPDVDPWLNPGFTPLDTRGEALGMADKLVEGATEEERKAIEAAEAELNQPPVPVEPAAAPAVEPPPVETEGPEVYEYEDGSKVVIEAVPTGLKATLSIGMGGDQVFYGQDREGLLQQLLAAQLNATRKIRDQNKQLKTKVVAQPVATAPAPKVRELTADDKFAIKNLMADDPSAALEELIKRKTGRSLEELASTAEEGRRASIALYCDTEARAFLEDHPRYLSHNENYMMLIGYLAKSKLGVELTNSNVNEVMEQLPARGFFTRQSLDEAYQALTSDGLLELEPEEPELPPEVPPAPAAPVAAQPAPTPAAPAAPASVPAGIPQGTPRPRVPSIAFGVQTPASSPETEPGTKGPSADELDALPTDEINKLFAAVRQQKAAQLRRK